MKWITKSCTPALGTKRTKRKFAWFPTSCGDYTVWLESYDSIQEYRVRLRATKFGGASFADWDEIDRLPLWIYL